MVEKYGWYSKTMAQEGRTTRCKLKNGEIAMITLETESNREPEDIDYDDLVFVGKVVGPAEQADNGTLNEMLRDKLGFRKVVKPGEAN